MSRQIDADVLCRKIAGHSCYHGDKILSTVICMAEGKEVGDIIPCELPPDLNTIRDEVYADAVAHGLYEGEYDVPELERAAPGLMYRIQDEVREAWNAALDWQQGKEGAREHVAEELADIIITALSVSGHLGIDIHAALFRKKEINKKRSFKHKEEA